MPDPDRKTISATESPGLFGVSPYVTRWMLWHRFAHGVELDVEANSRMRWGRLLQPLILDQAVKDLRLEIKPNADDTYVRRGLLGCTRDATIICPDRGPGALETKCVFDYRDWMVDWQGGKAAPRHFEIQLQQQMAVGDGERTDPYTWGVIAVWVAGDLHYYERERIPELWLKLGEAAGEFFAAVRDGKEPDPFGVPIELPWLTKLLPTRKGKVIDLSGDPAADKHAEAASMYLYHKDQESGGKRAAEALRAKLLALAGDAEEVLLPGRVKIRIGGNEKSKRLSVYVPDELPASSPEREPGENLMAG
jgi:hypothetical protein